MGSSLSLQSKDKRRRSNRLSKPPQNQATPDSPGLRASSQSVEQAVSLPASPLAWRNPWTSVSVPADEGDMVIQSPRSQSLASKPLQRQTKSQSSGTPVGKRRLHSTASLSPESSTSPTAVPSRQASVYGRSSFHPSETAMFQPTTLQSNPQSPLIGQPKRSYSVHLRSQNAKDGAQRRTLDRFASISSHSRAKIQESLPIRRRTLLMRPGVATRDATKSTPPTFFSEAYHDDIFPARRGNSSFDSTLRRLLAHDEGSVDDSDQPLSQLCPSTANDSGYTHIGALRLGSLRVVNGATSPCPSDRTRLSHADGPASQVVPSSLNPAELLEPVRKESHVSRPASAGGLSVETDYHSTLENPSVLDHATDNLYSAFEPSHQNLPGRPAQSSRNNAPATILNIPSAISARAEVDFPASPFSFSKSPVVITGHMDELRETEDEGISVREHDQGITPLPEKVPERHLSYSSCASSHRRVDSGYSSAASHRNSIDSHASIQRPPGLRRLILADSSRETDLRDGSALSRARNQHSVNRHLSLQDRKLNQQNENGQPEIIPGEQHNHPQTSIAGRPRGASLPVSGTSEEFALPLYCAQLRDLDSTSSVLSSCAALQGGTSWDVQVEKSVCSSYAIGSPNRHATSVSGHQILDKKHQRSIEPCRAASDDDPSQQSQPHVTTGQHRHPSGGVKSDVGSPISGGGSHVVQTTGQSRNRSASEASRGRTRDRSIAHQHFTFSATTPKP